MEFRNISADLTARGLSNCHLEALVPDNNNYQILAYQHKGEVEGDNQNEMFVRNVDRKLALNKFDAFVTLVREVNVELALSPEYSCPWETIENIINDDLFPNSGKVWAFGCESIKPETLRVLMRKLEKENLYFIYDETIVESQEKRFLDPICFLFRTTRIEDNQSVIVIAIQFKTNPMGGTPFEQDGLLEGRYAYRFKNEGTSVNLVCFICSDVLQLDMGELKRQLDWNESYLFIHLQLNNNRADNFEMYKTQFLLNEAEDSNKEIFALNWARGSKLASKDMIYGGSAFYIKSTHVNEEDSRVNQNDDHGCYYSYWKNARVNTYFFDYDEYVFSVRTDKASKALVPAVQNKMKRGAIMENRYYWNSGWEIFNEKRCDLEICCEQQTGLNFGVLNNLESINKERLICLANGNGDIKDWFKPKLNGHFLFGNNQVNKRIVFHHDPDTETQTTKEIAIARYGEMVTSLVVNPNSFPKERFLDIKDECEIFYNPNSRDPKSYSINARNRTSNDIKATVVYLGDCLDDLARKKLMWMCENFGESRDKERILVWYRNNGLKSEYLGKGGDPSVLDNTSTSGVSYKKLRE